MITRAQLYNYWDKLFEAQDRASGKVFGRDQGATTYPSEAAMDMLSAYLVAKDDPSFPKTKADAFLKAAERQLSFARELGSNDLINRGDGVYGRDVQSRQIYNFAVAGILLHDPKYLAWALQCASAMSRRLKPGYYQPSYIPRALGYQLFWATYVANGEADIENCTTIPTGYIPVGGDPQGWPRGAIDPNQNAAIGLAFTLLFKNGRFVEPPPPPSIGWNKTNKNFTLTTIQDEFGATIALQQYQDMEHNDRNDDFLVYHGALPENDSLDRRLNYDTMYAGITYFYWAVAYAYCWEKNTTDSKSLGGDLKKALDAAGQWLSQDTFANGFVNTARRCYKDDHISPANPPSYECWFRFVLYWITDRLTPERRMAWAQQALDLVVNHELPGCHGTDYPKMATPFCFFRLLKIPEKEFLPPTDP